MDGLQAFLQRVNVDLPLHRHHHSAIFRHGAVLTLALVSTHGRYFLTLHRWAGHIHPTDGIVDILNGSHGLTLMVAPTGMRDYDRQRKITDKWDCNPG